MKEIEIYTDGGCHGNPGPGGWAFVMQFDGETITRNGHEAATTNNRMELRAVIEALKLVRTKVGGRSRPVSVFTDSQYVRGGVTEWIKRWVANGWKTSAGKPVKNQELWRELQRETEGLDVSWHWVRGHAGNSRNELCDSLVQSAIANAQSRH